MFAIMLLLATYMEPVIYLTRYPAEWREELFTVLLTDRIRIKRIYAGEDRTMQLCWQFDEKYGTDRCATIRRWFDANRPLLYAVDRAYPHYYRLANLIQWLREWGIICSFATTR